MMMVSNKSKTMEVLVAALMMNVLTVAVVGQVDIDFANAVPDPVTGKLCVTQQICIADAEALSRALPAKPCFDPNAMGCNCVSDDECGGGLNRCVSCRCKECPDSVRNGEAVINPPLTFVVDTTKSVRPDKDSIFNLTQKVVQRIQDTDTNIPEYQLITFNDFGPDIRLNVEFNLQTQDVTLFRQTIMSLEFESYDGGRDSKERMMQGLWMAVMHTMPKSLVVVFTDNGSKDLELAPEIKRIAEEKNIEILVVLTPIYEGFPNDKSLEAYAQVGTVFNIAEVGADFLLNHVETFEETNCI